MQKPNNYENTDAFTGDFQRLTPGGKICMVVKAYESKSKASGSPQVTLEYDILEGAEMGYFAAQSEQWGGDWKGVFRQGTTDKTGNCSPWFKGMILAFEESNRGFKFDFDETKLNGKQFGGVFGEEEYIGKDGTVKTAVKLMQIRSTDAIRKGNFKIPPKKTVSGTTQPAVDNGITSVESEDIPF
jgi:hypothetical protein